MTIDTLPLHSCSSLLPPSFSLSAFEGTSDRRVTYLSTYVAAWLNTENARKHESKVLKRVQ